MLSGIRCGNDGIFMQVMGQTNVYRIYVSFYDERMIVVKNAWIAANSLRHVLRVLLYNIAHCRDTCGIAYLQIAVSMIGSNLATTDKPNLNCHIILFLS